MAIEWIDAGKRLGRMGLAVIALCLPAMAHAIHEQNPAAIQAQAEQYLKKQTLGQPGKVSIQVAPPSSPLPACAALEAFLPVGSRSIGKIAVGVRCLTPSAWTVYLSAQVHVIGLYAVTQQPLPANHALNAIDITLREGDLGSLPADIVTKIDDLQGYRTVSGLAAGAPLRTALLRAPLAVRQGQITRVVLNGPGFSIRNEGQALGNASRGDLVRVKTRSGQVISGIAADGQQVIVEF